MNEDAVVERLRQVERTLPGGEVRDPATCRAQLAEWRRREPDIEYRCAIADPTAQRVFLGVCLRYGLVPYHPSKRARVTLCVRVPRGFMRQVLWPEVEAAARVLERELAAATRRVVEQWAGVSFAGVAAKEPSSVLE